MLEVGVGSLPLLNGYANLDEVVVIGYLSLWPEGKWASLRVSSNYGEEVVHVKKMKGMAQYDWL